MMDDAKMMQKAAKKKKIRVLETSVKNSIISTKMENKKYSPSEALEISARI